MAHIPPVTDSSESEGDDDLDNGLLSPQAQRRRRRRNRERRSGSTSAIPGGSEQPNLNNTEPIPDDDPLLADGDIQFEWQS